MVGLYILYREETENLKVEVFTEFNLSEFLSGIVFIFCTTMRDDHTLHRISAT